MIFECRLCDKIANSDTSKYRVKGSVRPPIFCDDCADRLLAKKAEIDATKAPPEGER